MKSSNVVQVFIVKDLKLNSLRFLSIVCVGSSFCLLVSWIGVFVLFVCGEVFPDLVYVVFIVV